MYVTVTRRDGTTATGTLMGWGARVIRVRKDGHTTEIAVAVMATVEQVDRPVTLPSEMGPGNFPY